MAGEQAFSVQFAGCSEGEEDNAQRIQCYRVMRSQKALYGGSK